MPRLPKVNPESSKSDAEELRHEGSNITQSVIDELEALARNFIELQTWTKDKYVLKQAMLATAERHNMYRFRSRAQFFGIARLPHIGETSVVSVPHDHRGKLKPFRGRTVKLICLDNVGSNDRLIVAYEHHTPNST